MIYVRRRYSHVTRQNQWFHLISATLGVLRAETTLSAFSTLFGSVWCNMSMLSFVLSCSLFRRQELRFRRFLQKFLQFLSFDGRLMPSSRKIHAQWLHRSLGAHLETSEERPRHFSPTLGTRRAKKTRRMFASGQFSSPRNSIVFIIPSPANYLEFSSSSPSLSRSSHVTEYS